jgi:Tol biopolymer transport system component
MNWTRTFVSATVLAACGWLAPASVFTQSGSDGPAQLRAAMHRETVQGDLDGAIAEYRRIADGSADRSVKAQALLRLGTAYEKLGRPEARTTYERVVTTYADQPKVAAAARARLAKVGAAAVVKKSSQAENVARRVLEGQDANLLDITPDGRLAIGAVRRGYSAAFPAGQFDVVLCDLTTGAIRVLVAGDAGWRGLPRISDDGSQVAYAWDGADGRTKALRVVSTKPGATARSIVAGETMNVAPVDWAPDGRSILVTVSPVGGAQGGGPNSASHDLAWIDPNSGAVRTIKRLEKQHWSVLPAPRVSPDGRYVALLTQAPTSTDSYVEVIDANGHQVTTLVAAAGMRRSLMWGPDGGHLLYLEGTNLRSDLWAVPVRDGQRAGDPIMLQRDADGAPIGRRIIGITADGTLLSGRRVGGESHIYISDRRPAAGAPVSLIKGLSESWSKDGRSLAYLQLSGDKWNLVLRDLETGQERTFPHPALRTQTPLWRDDGSALIVLASRGQSSDSSADQVMQQVDLRTGTYTDLFARTAEGYLRSRGALSPDGKMMYMARMNQARTAIADLVARDLVTGADRILTTIDAGPSRDPDAGIALSPDGRTLAVTVWNTVLQDARLFTIGVDGTGRRDVVASFPTGGIHSLSWDSDGQSLLVMALDQKKNWRLMRVPATGGTLEPDGLDHDTLESLLDGVRLVPGNFSTFSLRPDGTKIAASTLTAPKTEVWALDVMPLLAQKP